MLKFLFVVFILIFPVLMILYSLVMKKASSKNNKKSIGFPSPFARQNKKVWAFANKTASRYFYFFGMILFVLGVILSLITCIFIKSPDVIVNIFTYTLVVELIIIFAGVIFVCATMYSKFGEKKNGEKHDS